MSANFLKCHLKTVNKENESLVGKLICVDRALSLLADSICKTEQLFMCGCGSEVQRLCIYSDVIFFL